jgi:hypothetical protein
MYGNADLQLDPPDEQPGAMPEIAPSEDYGRSIDRPFIIATGGDGFTIFKECKNPETIGSDVGALEAHVSILPQPFGVPTDFGQRITKQ